MRCAPVIVSVVLLASLWSGPAEASFIGIDEVLADPGGLDVNGDGVASNIHDEFIELLNYGDLPTDLSGWSVADAVRTRHVFAPGTMLPPGGRVVIFGGGDPPDLFRAIVASSGRLALNNRGDIITLHSDLNLLIDEVAYSTSLSGESFARAPEGVGPLVRHSRISALPFSPGSSAGGGLSAERDSTNPPVIPEPTTLVSWAMGWLGLTISRRGWLLRR